VSQYVNYAPNYQYITSYAEVDFNPTQRGGGEEIDYPYFALDVSSADNKTLQVIQYDYTQIGVFMQLVKP
jgi:hypothetical protein